MNFSNEFSTEISLACVGIAGMTFLYSRQKYPSTDDYKPKTIKENLEVNKI